jgi:hypothetical protein
LDVQRVDHLQRDRDLLAGGGGKLQRGEPLALLQAQQVAALRDPVVVEHRLDPLLPLGPLMRERMTQAHPAAQIQDVSRRDPRFGQPPDQEQLAQMPRVCPVGLGALALALQPAGLGRLGEMHLGANSLELLREEPPAGRGLQRDLEILTGETLKELPHSGPVGRCDPRAEHLRGDRVDPLG